MRSGSLRSAMAWAMRVFTAAGLGAVLASGAASGVEIGPEDNLCAAANALRPGEELILRPGLYRGPCSIRRGGVPGQPVTIRAADLGQRPRVVYGGGSSNVFNVHADHVVIRGLEIGPTQANVDGIRIYRATGITVEDCVFTQLGGIAVVANHSDVHGVLVRRNTIRASRATAMYFGCHDGAGCVVSGLLVEGNHIRGVEAGPEQVGYGVQVKLNSSAIIRDNVIMATKGPGIMVYGAQLNAPPSLVERNVVAGARTAPGIVVGGGPAVVRNNVVLQSGEGGIGLQDYAGRGLLRSVVVAHNSLWDNALGGVRVLGNGLEDVLVVNNAVHAPDGTLAFPPARPGLRLLGNVDCSRTRCFADPGRRDFSPMPGSPLMNPGGGATGPWAPADDLVGIARGARATAGAIQHSAPPISLDPTP
jgi:Right handed beta helix region